jgi:hypothetical protein
MTPVRSPEPLRKAPWDVISWISGFMGAVCLGEGRATFKNGLPTQL